MLGGARSVGGRGRFLGRRATGIADPWGFGGLEDAAESAREGSVLGYRGRACEYKVHRVVMRACFAGCGGREANIALVGSRRELVLLSMAMTANMSPVDRGECLFRLSRPFPQYRACRIAVIAALASAL